MFVLVSSIIFTAFVYLSTPIEAYDFFWHLKTGEHIWQNKELPSKDPFSYTTPPPQSSREQFILKGYWLAQLVYYLSYSWGGFNAIVLLRFLILGALIYFMIRQKEGDNVVYMGLLLMGLSCILREYFMDRPQVFSFVFFAALLYLLKTVKTGADYPVISTPDNKQLRAFSYIKPVLPISLLMLVWANMHSAALLGQGTILLFMILEGAKFIHPSLRPIEKSSFKRLLIAGLFGIGISFLNPNTYHAPAEMLNMPDYMTYYVTEYLSTIDLYRRFGSPAILLYWLVLLLALAVLLLNLKKFDITEIALIAGTGFFSFTQNRYIPFFLIAAIPIAGKYLSGKKIIHTAKVLIVLMALITGFFFAWDERSNIRNFSSEIWLTNLYFPVKAADFIIENDLRGNMYNFYNWGGFLIWKLSPTRKVFTDGRALSETIFEFSVRIDSADTTIFAGTPGWKAILEAYNVKYLLIPFYQKSGKISPLTNALLKENKWMPVFFYDNSIIFVKDSWENAEVIRKFAIPKETFVSQ